MAAGRDFPRSRMLLDRCSAADIGGSNSVALTSKCLRSNGPVDPPQQVRRTFAVSNVGAELDCSKSEPLAARR